jgi:hypothetical protein
MIGTRVVLRDWDIEESGMPHEEEEGDLEMGCITGMGMEILEIMEEAQGLCQEWEIQGDI